MTKKQSSRAKRRIEHASTVNGSEAASLLESLAAGLRNGTVTVGEAADGFATRFSGDVDIELYARRGKRKTRIDLTLALRGEPGDDVSPSLEPATLPDEMTF